MGAEPSLTSMEEQYEHLLAFAADHVPVGHGYLFVPLQYDPAGQSAQDLPFKYCPAEQADEVEEEESLSRSQPYTVLPDMEYLFNSYPL